jgi:formiminotetrahydrofolate cyclodeaminase
MIAQQPISRFLDELASAAPTPGGGSAAAVMGAMGAALVSMVCHLTIGRKDCEGVEVPMRQALGEAEALRHRLTAMIEDDVQAFEALMAAYRLPRASEDDKLTRGAAIQRALKHATDVPLACASACAEVIALSQRIAAIGHRGVISDAGVAVLSAHAALRSAALNVYINVPSTKDAEFAQDRRTRLEALLEQCAVGSEQTYNAVLKRLG